VIRIERLRMRVPDGFEARGDSIARLVAKSLSDLSAGANDRRATLSVPTVRVRRGDSNAQIAQAVGRALARELPVSRNQDPGV
jgi:hypothetical protein